MHAVLSRDRLLDFSQIQDFPGSRRALCVDDSRLTTQPTQVSRPQVTCRQCPAVIPYLEYNPVRAFTTYGRLCIMCRVLQLSSCHPSIIADSRSRHARRRMTPSERNMYKTLACHTKFVDVQPPAALFGPTSTPVLKKRRCNSEKVALVCGNCPSTDPPSCPFSGLLFPAPLALCLPALVPRHQLSATGALEAPM